MDSLTITTTCISLIGTIGKTSIAVTKFVRDVRSARSDLDAVARDLLSLETVLEFLAEDIKESSTSTFPQILKKQIAGIVTNCSGVVVQIEETLKKHEGSRITKAGQWVAFGKGDVAKLQSSLEAHKSALELALHIVTLTLAKDIKQDTQDILDDTSAIKQDTAQILAQIARLPQQLPQDVNRNDTSRFMLDKYLDGLTSYAETVYDTFTDDFDQYKNDDAGSINGSRSSSPVSIYESRSPSPVPVANKGKNVVQTREKDLTPLLPIRRSSPIVSPKATEIKNQTHDKNSGSSSNTSIQTGEVPIPPPLPSSVVVRQERNLSPISFSESTKIKNQIRGSDFNSNLFSKFKSSRVAPPAPLLPLLLDFRLNTPRPSPIWPSAIIKSLDEKIISSLSQRRELRRSPKITE